MEDSHIDLLILHHDRAILDQLGTLAREEGWSCLLSDRGEEAPLLLDRNRFGVVVIEAALPGMSGLQILEWLKTRPETPAAILLLNSHSAGEELKGLKLGAFACSKDFLENPNRLATSIKQALEKRDADSLRKRGEAGFDFGGGRILGTSAKMNSVFELLEQVSGSDSNVLISGESGTGKELVAKALHRNGPRADKPFVVINSAAMPDTLFESELFGYTKGAFTGAATDKAGLFETADGGTVFLDEIGDIPLATQVKLLRVLQEGEVRPLGGTVTRHVNVRVIAATNKNLTEMVQRGKFREDLFYRLNVIHVPLPPLRERIEDIPLLARHFLKKMSLKTGRQADTISVDAMEALQNYSWPGNVRELENIIERAVVLCNGGAVLAKNLPPKILSASFYNVATARDDWLELNYKEAKKRALNLFNRSYIIELLKKTGGNITAASDRAGMDRSNFKKIIRKYRIPVS